MIRINDWSSGTVRVAAAPNWLAGLVGLGAAAMGVAVLTLGAGLVLLVAPFAVAGFLLARWRLKDVLRQTADEARARQAAERGRCSASGAAPRRDVIDVEYRVIDGERR